MSAHVSYGDNVRILRTAETERLGIADLIGNVYGETTPSDTKVEVIGKLESDYAVNVYFDTLDVSYWFAPQMLEFVGHAPGTEIHVQGSPFKSVRQPDGTWKDIPVGPEGGAGMARKSACADRALPWLLLLYCGASLLHFIHNAEYIAEYPNLPAWISRASIYLAWLATFAVGLCGYLLYRGRYAFPGLILLAVYAILGFDGLLHYGRAPLSAHTSGMNATIWFEVVTAAFALSAVSLLAARRMRQ